MSAEVVHRKVGTVQWLRDQHPAEFNNFYQCAATMTSSQMVALIRRQTTASKEQSWSYAEDGEGRPLGYWKTQGYDVAEIEAKAPEEDKELDPIYGWINYKVRVKSTGKREDHKTTDALQILAKARTRALKRRRTDEESLPQEPEPASDFSDEESGGSSSEDFSSQRRHKDKALPKGKAKGKQKAKKTSADVAAEKKAKEDMKLAAAAVKKLKDAISGLRLVASHHLILDVPEDLFKAVHARVRELQTLERKCSLAAQGQSRSYEWHDEFGDLDWTTIKKEKAALKSKLLKLEKAF